MSRLTPFERKTQYAALAFFLAGCALVALLQFTIGLYFTSHYFVAHFLLGLFLPFLIYSFGGSDWAFWIGISLTAAFHFGYEFWEDQLDRNPHVYDWAQIASGALGMVAAYAVFCAWRRWGNRPSDA